MTILIEDLSFDTIIGILEHERLNPQNVRIDCIIDYPYHPNRFINYAEVASLIELTMKTERFELIETALDTLAAKLQHAFPSISTLTLTIRKPDILSNCTVGVSMKYDYVTIS